MIVRLCVLLIIICLAGSTTSVAFDSDWPVLLNAAEKVSRQARTNDSQLVSSQDSAIFIALEALAIARHLSDNSDTTIGYILNHIGDYHFRAGRHGEAVAKWSEALSHYQKEFSQGDRQLDASLLRFSLCEGQRFDFPEINLLVTESVDLRKSLMNSHEAAVSVRLRQLAEIYLKHDLVEKGKIVYRRIIALWEQNQTSSPEYAIKGLILLAEAHAKFLANLGSDVHHQDSAIVLGSKALKMAQDAFGDSSLSVAYVLQRLGDYHGRNGELLVAETMWQWALNINFAQLPEEHIEYQGSNYRIGMSHLRFGRYTEAEPMLVRALRLRIKTQGAGHPEVASMNIALAQLYRRTGNYTKAERHFREALRIRKNAIEQVPSDIGQSYRYLGQLFGDQGRYSLAENNFRKAYEIRNESLGAEHSLTIATLDDLAGLFINWGRMDEAHELLTKVLKSRREYLGETHPGVASTLADLATISSQQGDYLEAIVYFDRALEIIKNSMGEYHSEYTRIIGLSAKVYEQAGEYKMAESLYQEAHRINVEILAPSSFDMIASIDGLATILCRQDRFDEGAALYEEAARLAEATTAKEHPAVATFYENYSRLQIALGNPERAIELADQALKIRHLNFSDGAQVMAEFDVLRYARQLTEARDLYLTASLLAANNETHPESTFLAILRTKGVVTDEIIRRTRTLNQTGEESLMTTLDLLRFVESRLSRLYVEGPGDGDEQSYRLIIDSVQRERHRLEALVASSSRSITGADQELPIHLADIQTSIPDSTVLIEYLRFDYHRSPYDRSIPSYLAVVLERDGEPRLVPLGSAAPIDSLVQLYSEHLQEAVHSKRLLSEKQNEIQLKLSIDLYRSVWRPLAPYLPAGGLILIAPDGALNLLSFAALSSEDGEYLIENYAVHYLSSGRDLARIQREVVLGEGLFILGDPDFNYDFSSQMQLASQSATTSVVYGSFDRLRDLRSTCGPIGELSVSRLPGTLTEINGISKLWTEGQLGSLWKYSGAEASEENFKLYAPGKRVVHLATHGYFANACEGDSLIKHGKIWDNLIEENPLLQSGLFFSGVNNRNSDANNVTAEDGVLTAEEVCSMDFSKTEWVVLSACESGRGALRGGEGVYGLRRSFLLAGARTVISSLWPVGDAVTEKMMGRLYRSSNANVGEAIREVMLERLEDLRRRQQPEHPALWAPFISVGDWTTSDQTIASD